MKQGREKDNFQDEAEKKEYKKGFRAGKSSRSGGRGGRRGGKSDAKRQTNDYAIIAGDVNDPNWNAPTQQILQDAFSIPFAEVLGIRVPLAGGIFDKDMWNLQGGLFGEPYIDPHFINTFYFAPTYGQNVLSTDAINTGANSFYAYVVHMNSRSKSYDAPDLMQYGIALDSAYMWYSHLVRVYGLISYYQWYNRAVPGELIKQLGFNFDDLMANLADFRAFINTTAYRLQQLFFPTGFDFMTRHQWIVRDVYVDSTQMKAQMYAFVPTSYYVWREGPVATKHAGGYNEAVSIVDYGDTKLNDMLPLFNLRELIAFTDTLISPLVHSQDFNLMSADIMKAFPAGSQMVVRGISDTYAMKPVYSRELLMEIENMDIAHCVPAKFVCEIYQPGTIGDAYLVTQAGYNYDVNIEDTFGGFKWYDKSSKKFTSRPTEADKLSPFVFPVDDSIIKVDEAVLNMHMENPTPKDVTVAINLKTDRPTKNGNHGTIKSMMYYNGYGTEIVMLANMVRTNGNYTYYGSNTVYGIPPAAFVPTNVTVITGWQQKLYGYLSQFDWHPIVRSILLWQESDAKTVQGQLSPICVDIDNYTTLNLSTISQMHTIANLSKFTNKNMGAFSPK